MDVYFVVRFSLRLNPEWEEKTFGGDPYREKWFEFRAKLFKNTIYRSVKEQTVEECKIILLMDKSDQAYYEKYLGLDDIFPVFCDRFDFMGEIENIVNNHSIEQGVVLSRVDSDDILKPTYMQEVLESTKQAAGKGDVWVVATDGARYDLANYQRLFYSVSPFISYVSFNNNIENIYGFNHELVSEKSDVICLKSESPLWCQILHGSNVANSFWASLNEDEFKSRKARNEKAAALSLQNGDSFYNNFQTFYSLPRVIEKLVKSFEF